MKIKITILKYLLIKIFILFSILIISSCQKELSYEGQGVLPAGTATFSIADNTGTCPAIVVKGEYRIAIPVSPDNKIEVSVMVDSIGTYNIASSSLNGISFSGSGVFSGTGKQNITLIAKGVPVAPGNFIFSINNSSCTFTITVQPKPRATAVFTYDGAPGPCTNLSRSGNFSVGVPLSEINSVWIDVNVLTPGVYSVTTAMVNGFVFTGTGELPTAGYGVVKLIATGTPITEGAFIFTPPNGCPFGISVAP